MSNNNNQFNNNSNNNLNITNEVTMNYTSMLQNLLTELTAAKEKNIELKNSLATDKANKETVESNNKVIQDSLAEFQNVLNSYKEDNEVLETLVAQEKALALIAQIKALVDTPSVEPPTESIEVVKDTTVVEDMDMDIDTDSVEENVEVMPASSSIETDSTNQIADGRAASICDERAALEAAFKAEGEVVKPYAVSSKEGWRHIVRFDRPENEEDFKLALTFGCCDGLGKYLLTLDEVEYARFLEMNRDIISTFETKQMMQHLMTYQKQELEQSFVRAEARKAILEKRAAENAAALSKEINLELYGNEILAVTDEEFLEVTGEARPTSKKQFRDMLKNNQRFVDYIGTLSYRGIVSFKRRNKDILNHFTTNLIEQICVNSDANNEEDAEFKEQLKERIEESKERTAKLIKDRKEFREQTRKEEEEWEAEERESNLRLYNHEVMLSRNEDYLKVTGKPRPTSKRGFKNMLNSNQLLIDYIGALSITGLAVFDALNKDLINNQIAKRIKQLNNNY